MSADNGFYVAKFPDGFRWCYGSAIDNLDYYDEGTMDRKKMLKRYFGKSPVYNTEREALNDAYDAMKEYGWTEYGLCLLGEFESFTDAPEATE